MTGLVAASGAALSPPPLWRRLACMVYEGIILFGLVMVAGYLYSSLTQQRHALQGTAGLQAFLFIVIGVYFVGFWSRTGQTLPMKTWHLRLVRGQDGPVPQWQALLRYVLSWLWFVPALASAHFSGVRSGLAMFLILTVGIGAYVAMARLRADRQFLHDLACGTRVIDTRPLSAQSGA
jgi:uncharacterized RDD family membrane protein YckC